MKYLKLTILFMIMYTNLAFANPNIVNGFFVQANQHCITQAMDETTRLKFLEEYEKQIGNMNGEELSVIIYTKCMSGTYDEFFYEVANQILNRNSN